MKRLPKNGWALKGLVIAYSNLNNLSEAKNIEEQFKKAWVTADVDQEYILTFHKIIPHKIIP